MSRKSGIWIRVDGHATIQVKWWRTGPDGSPHHSRNGGSGGGAAGRTTTSVCAAARVPRQMRMGSGPLSYSSHTNRWGSGEMRG
jgi:hypothetical protein